MFTKQQLIDIKQTAAELKIERDNLDKEIREYARKTLVNFSFSLTVDDFEIDILLSLLYNGANNRLYMNEYTE